MLVLPRVLHHIWCTGTDNGIATGQCILSFPPQRIVSRWVVMPVDLLLLSFVCLEGAVEKADLAQCGSSRGPAVLYLRTH